MREWWCLCCVRVHLNGRESDGILCLLSLGFLRANTHLHFPPQITSTRKEAAEALSAASSLAQMQQQEQAQTGKAQTSASGKMEQMRGDAVAKAQVEPQRPLSRGETTGMRRSITTANPNLARSVMSEASPFL